MPSVVSIAHYFLPGCRHSSQFLIGHPADPLFGACCVADEWHYWLDLGGRPGFVWHLAVMFESSFVGFCTTFAHCSDRCFVVRLALCVDYLL